MSLLLILFGVALTNLSHLTYAFATPLGPLTAQPDADTSVSVQQEDLERELQQLKQELAAARAARDRPREVNALIYVALTYEKLRQFSNALEHYQQALGLLPPDGNPSKTAAVLYQIGDCYLGLGQHQQSLEHFNRALALWRRAEKPEMEAQTLVQLGGVYRLLGQYDKSLKCFADARQLFKALKDFDSEASRSRGTLKRRLLG